MQVTYILNTLCYHFAIFFVTLLSGFVFIGTGLFIINKAKASFESNSERLFFTFGIGAGISGYSLAILSAAQLLYPLYIYALMTALLVSSVMGWKSFQLSKVMSSNFIPSNLTEKFAAAGTLILLAAALVMSLTPETGKDSLVYHLSAPKLYLKHHGFFFIPGSIYSNLPFQAEMLYLAGLFLQGDLLAKGLNFLAFPVILLGIGLFSVHKMRSSHPYTSMFIFAMIPSVFELAHVSYSDLYATLFIFGAVYAFVHWFEREETFWILVSALFTGLAISTKYSALILPFLGFLGILINYRNAAEGKAPLRTISLYLLISSVTGLPYYIKNWVLTGNPLYPFYYGVFGGRGLDEELARLYEGLYKYMGMGRSFADYLLLPWNLSFHAKMNSIQFDGVIGPTFLLLLPLLFFIRKQAANRNIITVYCLISFAFWASSSQDIRYLLPVFPFLAVLCGVVFTHFSDAKTVLVYARSVLACALLLNGYLICKDIIKTNPFHFIIGMEERSAFLERSLSTYKIYSIANRVLPTEANLFLVNMRNYTFLCDMKCYSDTMFETETLRKVLVSSSSGKEVHDKLKNMGFTHIMYDESYITGKKSLLNSAEKSLFIDYNRDFLTEIGTDRTYHLCSL